MSRESILAKIRSSLAGKTGAGRESTVAARLAKHPAGIIPASQAKAGGLIEHFMQKANQASASVEIVQRSETGTAITRFLRNHNLPKQLRCGSDLRLKSIVWPKSGAPRLSTGASDGNDLTGLSHAFAGVSETGTLVLLSGPSNPTTINFLPENHICLVEASDLVASYEAAWSRLRSKLKGNALPRTINMITGPSRSADIEQTLILGAHGPVRLHVIIVKD